MVRPGLIWVALLTAASAATTLALACATPFAALAAIAATRLRMREGLLLMALAWATSQAIGFGLLHFPQDWRTIAWGPAMLSGAIAATLAAGWGARHAPRLATATAFGTGFLAYKAVLLGWSAVLGGVHVAASPYWTARQFVQEGAILIVLEAAYLMLVAIGVPRGTAQTSAATNVPMQSR